LLEPAHVAPQTPELLALLGGQPVTALTGVKLVLLDPVPGDCGETPSSSASCGIDFSDERTNATASRLNCSGYGGVDGMDTDPSCQVRRPSDQVSTKAGELQMRASALARTVVSGVLSGRLRNVASC
jgi:hypothetical protein